MSLLIPQLERQLRSAVRSGRASAVGGTAASPGSRRPRLGPLGVALTVVSSLVALGVVAVIFVSVHSSQGAGSAQPQGVAGVTIATGGIPHGTWCGERVASRDVGRDGVVLAQSDRSGWALARASISIPGVARFTGLLFYLGGHAYLACSGGEPIITQLPGRNVFWTLTDDTPGPAGHDRLTITRPAGATIEHRQVASGTLFVALLPHSACHDRSLTAVLRGPAGVARFTLPMPKCLPATPPAVVPVTAPAGLTRRQLERFKRGDVVFGQAGCLACHQLSGYGNNGPGPNLTGIGSRLTTAQLRRVLTNPTAPMPSYRALAHDYRKRFGALLYFLSELRR